MKSTIHAYAAAKAGGPLTPFDYEAGPLGHDQVEIKVHYCGVCHSDLSMLDNEWQMSAYPFVPGHEVAGKIVAVGEHVTHLKVGQLVGLGWNSASCLTCPTCMAGDHNLCPTAEMTMIGRHGGFADRVRCQAAWAIPIPTGVDAALAGPLFCGGVTVFNPLVQFGVKPTDRVGVVGIGGLGHLAVKFLNKWGCEVTAFTSSEKKADEARKFGAHNVVASGDSQKLAALAGSLNFILVTANVTLDWNAYLNALAPKGRLHVVGAVLQPMPIPAMTLLTGQRSVSGSPLGSPATTMKMLAFCARHNITPTTELFPMSKVNEAMAHLRAGKARYRLVLQNDFRD
jgi:uncharacterized zinc-type alcohol dehydrogenase-like protein